jgi:hypothetical protein
MLWTVLIIVFLYPFAQLFVRAMENKGSDDPVYKRNLQKLIERHRQFEDARE